MGGCHRAAVRCDYWASCHPIRVRAGPKICGDVWTSYDLEFPEWTRTLALAGADLIAVPTNWPLVPEPVGERAPEVVIATGNRTGTERGQAWTSGTAIVGADGWVLAETLEATEVSADIDLLASRQKALASQAHLLDDRRPQLYGRLTAPKQ